MKTETCTIRLTKDAMEFYAEIAKLAGVSVETAVRVSLAYIVRDAEHTEPDSETPA